MGPVPFTLTIAEASERPPLAGEAAVLDVLEFDVEELPPHDASSPAQAATAASRADLFTA